jgi:glycosyltransferase involved in cell wall biosynthesis
MQRTDITESTLNQTSDFQSVKFKYNVSNSPRTLRIAMIGQKGLPATYGGVEHHVENLSVHLVKMGHKVTVYCRPYYSADLEKYDNLVSLGNLEYMYKSINLKLVNSINTKHLDTITHSLASTLISNKRDFDIVHFHGIGPSSLSLLPKIANIRCISTIHALDYRQKKWNKFSRICLRLGLQSALRFPDKTICVSRTIQQNLGYPAKTVFIPNGVKEPDRWGNDEMGWLFDNGLSQNNYILFVGRLIEDKNCHLLCRAIKESGIGLKLAVAGASSYTDDYVYKLKEMAGPETVFLGNVYGGKLSALYHNCSLFVLPSLVEGLPIVLLEAMKHGSPILASDIPENIEILNGDPAGKILGLTFKRGDLNSLKSMIYYAISNPEICRKNALAARLQVDQNYNWEKIARQTESLYQDL